MTNVKTYRYMTEQEKKFLREQLKITRDGDGVLRRAHNILQLTSIPRTYKGKNLKTFQLEGQVKLFTTTWGENCYYKFPGRESLRIGRYNCPYDFRPVCPKSLLTGDASKDFSAEEIFLTTAYLMDKYPEIVDIFIALFAPLENLQFAKKSFDADVEIVVPKQHWANAMRAKQPVSHLYHRDYTVIDTYKHHLELYYADHPVACWEILNDTIDMSGTPFAGFSIQMFFYIVEGIVMNEDSKMSYLGKNDLLEEKKKSIYIGRSNTIRTMLADTCFAHGGMPVTEISAINSNSSRLKGMRPVPLYAIQNVANGIISIDEEMIAKDMKRFQKSVWKNVFPEGHYQMVKKETNLYGEVRAIIEALANRCLLKAGSIISPTCNEDIPAFAATLRECIPMDENGLVLEDVILDTAKPACIGAVVAGRSVSALDDWKTMDGISLRECRKNM